MVQYSSVLQIDVHTCYNAHFLRVIMSEIILTRLESLSNELLLDILEYLDGYTLCSTFYGLKFISCHYTNAMQRLINDFCLLLNRIFIHFLSKQCIDGGTFSMSTTRKSDSKFENPPDNILESLANSLHPGYVIL
jgi:hypothetical protein